MTNIDRQTPPFLNLRPGLVYNSRLNFHQLYPNAGAVRTTSPACSSLHNHFSQ